MLLNDLQLYHTCGLTVTASSAREGYCRSGSTEVKEQPCLDSMHRVSCTPRKLTQAALGASSHAENV